MSPLSNPARRSPLTAVLVLCAALLGLLTATGAPAAAASSTRAAPSDTRVVATFNVTTHTRWGQNVYVTGNLPELGSWNPDKAVPLSSASYPIWSGTVVLPANTPVEFKYLIKEHNAPVIWEHGANRTTVTPPTGVYITQDSFRY